MTTLPLLECLETRTLLGGIQHVLTEAAKEKAIQLVKDGSSAAAEDLVEQIWDAIKEHAGTSIAHLSESNPLLGKTAGELGKAAVVIIEGFWHITLIRLGYGGAVGTGIGIATGPLGSWLISHYMGQGCKNVEDPCTCQQSADKWGLAGGAALFTGSIGLSITAFIGQHWYQHFMAQRAAAAHTSQV